MDNRARAASVSTMGAEASETAELASPWWERRWLLVLVALATTVPLLYPAVPPLVDMPGHIGRFRVELDLDHSLWLQRYYGFHWSPLANLGVDILVLVLGPILGLEPAVKLIVIAIPPMTAVGMLWVAREVHGRVPPTAFFALPFIYGLPFLFGFVNFALSVAIAFLGFGLWLRLGRLGQTRLRGWLFVPVSLILFFCHAYGWGLLGLLCFSSDTVRSHDLGRPWARAVLQAAVNASVLALPLMVAIVLVRPGESTGGIGSGWFDWGAKWIGLYSMLRDRWGPFDASSVELGGLIFLFALASPKLKLSRKLVLSAVLLAISFVVLPRYMFDSAYSDVRLLPYLFAIGLLAIRLREPADPRLAQFLAMVGLAFFMVRLGGTTASLAMAADDQKAKLVALDHIPRGSRVVSFFGLPNAEPWALHRNGHLGGLVIARREGFSNDQWITGAHNLLTLRYRDAGGFAANPSEIVRPNGQHDAIYRSIDEALAQLPRNKFDYVWLIQAPPFNKQLVRDLQPVWSGPGTTLYRIRPAAGTH